MTMKTSDDLRHRTPLLQTHNNSNNNNNNNNHDEDDASSLSTATTHLTNGKVIRPRPDRNVRMLDRKGGFHQSNGEWRIQRIVPDKFSLYWWKDLYHTVLNSPTWRLFAVLYLLYTLLVLGFAAVYLFVARWNMYAIVPSGGSGSGGDGDGDVDMYLDSDGSTTTTTASHCGMDVHNFAEALYFSLSTMTTIGYGVSDYYFGDCWTPFVVVLLQVLCGITYDALAIGIIFQRLSRGQNRSNSVVFSNKAVIRRIQGKLYFMFQLCEQRKHQLAEAHVRLYCVRHERDHSTQSNMKNDLQVPSGDVKASAGTSSTSSLDLETCYFQTHMMRTQHPDDTLGAYLLMALPNVVVHGLDGSSPLVPPSKWVNLNGEQQTWNSRCRYTAKFPTPLKRDCDAESSISSSPANDSFEFGTEQEEITRFLQDREAEIVVIVEGIDEITSSTIQCRHSYRYDDIEWNHTFSPCVEPRSKNKRGRDSNELYSIIDGCTVDLGKFHELVPAPLDCESCHMVPNIG